VGAGSVITKNVPEESLAFTRPPLILGLRCSGRGDLIGAESLELDRIGAGFGRNVDEVECPRDVSVVVHARFGDDEVYFARFDTQGFGVGEEVRVTEAEGDSSYPSIDWNGTQFGISWQDSREGNPTIYFTLLNPQGVKTGGDEKISSGSGNSQFTTAVWTGDVYSFCFKDTRDGPAGNSEIYVANLGCL
jgi:hypothetical protein